MSDYTYPCQFHMTYYWRGGRFEIDTEMYNPPGTCAFDSRRHVQLLLHRIIHKQASLWKSRMYFNIQLLKPQFKQNISNLEITYYDYSLQGLVLNLKLNTTTFLSDRTCW